MTKLDFAQRYATWAAVDWSYVMLSDASTLQQFTARQQHVHRPVGKRYDVKYTIPTVKHLATIMIWGGFSHHGTDSVLFTFKNYNEWRKVHGAA